MNGKPGDSRNFVHKRLLGGIGGFLKGGPLGAIGGFLTGGTDGGETAIERRARQRQRRRPQPFTPTVARPERALPAPRRPPPILIQKAVPQTTTCPPGFQLTRSGCVPLGRRTTFELGPIKFGTTTIPVPSLPIAAQTGGFVAEAADFGDAVMGQFGAGIEPAVEERNVRLCPRGAVLGTDGICYNRRDIANSERFWPRGRRPLLTGGEMRCISIASAAAKKLQRKQKQLQDLGMLKKPVRRARAALAPGHHAHVEHD